MVYNILNHNRFNEALLLLWNTLLFYLLCAATHTRATQHMYHRWKVFAAHPAVLKLAGQGTELN